jgi:hypothetical protein
MKNIKAIIGSILLFIVVGYQVSNAQNPEMRNLQDFSGVDFSGAYEVILQASNETKIEVTGTKDIPNEDIVTEVKNGVLKVYFKKDKYKNINKSPKLIVFYKQLNSIDNSGAVNIKTEGTLQTNSLKIDVAGAGNLNLNINAEKLTVDMSGASNITLAGKAATQKYEVSGAGSINAYELEGNSVNVELSGVASAKVHAKQTLEVEISGMGSVRYRGNPQKLKTSESMMGSVKAE